MNSWYHILIMMADIYQSSVVDDWGGKVGPRLLLDISSSFTYAIFLPLQWNMCYLHCSVCCVVLRAGVCLKHDMLASSTKAGNA